MADSVREIIFRAVEATVRNVPGIGLVTRARIDPMQINNYPACMIDPGADNVVQEDLNVYLTRQLTVVLSLWVRSQTDIHIEVETFIPKVQQTMSADFRLGLGSQGPLLDFSEQAVSEPFPLDAYENDAGIVMEYIALYRVRRDNPYSWQ